MSTATLEWARVAPGTIVVADSKSAWIHHPDSFELSDPFGEPMQCAGSIETTRNLLEGALSAAQAAVARERKPETTPYLPLTPARWAWRLAGYYYTTHSTPTLMAEAARRFADAGRTELAEYAWSKTLDEDGHDRLALEDLRAMGYDAGQVVEAFAPATAMSLVRYFTQLVRGDNLVGCVGYAYALERLASAIDREHIAEVEAVLPPGVDATRCLRVHSGVGYDTDHVEDAIAVTAKLPARDREEIARVCYRTALLRHAAPQGEYLFEEELSRKLLALHLQRQPANAG